MGGACGRLSERVLLAQRRLPIHDEEDLSAMKGPVQAGLAISTVASRVVRFSAPEPHESATGLFDVQCSKLAARK